MSKLVKVIVILMITVVAWPVGIFTAAVGSQLFPKKEIIVMCDTNDDFYIMDLRYTTLKFEAWSGFYPWTTNIPNIGHRHACMVQNSGVFNISYDPATDWWFIAPMWVYEYRQLWQEIDGGLNSRCLWLWWPWGAPSSR